MDIASMGIIGINRVAATLVAAPPAGESVEGAEEAAASLTEQAQDPEFWINLFNMYGLPALKALILLFIAFIIASWVRKMTYKVLTKAKLDETLSKFASSMSRWGVLILAFIAILSIFGIETASFAVVLGSAGLAIGLAFQGSLGNLASGVMLLIFRPFKVGDVVQVNGITAKVEQIELFSTIVDTPDNRRIIIPNGAVFGNTIENISFHAKRRVDVAVGVDYSADIDQTREVLMSAAKALNDDAQGDPAVVLTGLGGSSVDWTVRVWVASSEFWPTKDKLTREVKVRLDEAGIGIPFPQMDVHIDGAIQR